MAGSQILRTALTVSACLLSALLIGCESRRAPSTLVGGYTFSRDFDDERRVLRIEPSSEFSAECVSIDLPVGGGASWKEVELDRDSHRALMELILDERRALQYELDTAASADAEAFVCKKTHDGKEFCYVPQLVVTGVSPPWRFALQPEVELSPESDELMDMFLSAHELCWNGTTANAGSSAD